MILSHALLAIFWITYCLIHSLLAGTYVKERIAAAMRKKYKYYRPAYSVFAAATLALIIWFQLSITSLRLFKQTGLVNVAGVVVTLLGSGIMLACIHKYFYELSGLQAIHSENTKNTLQQTGLHKYVRHPLYLGTLLFIWGLFMIFPLLSNIIAGAIITIYVLIGISLEEKKLYVEYGNAYMEYSKKVPGLIPHLISLKKGSV